MTNYQSQTIS